MLYNEKDKLEELRESKKKVILFTMNGFQMRGNIVASDENTVLFKSDQVEHIIFKHAISTIKLID